MFATIDIDICNLAACDGKKCAAKASCPTKAIWQPELGEPPFMDAGRCTGCRKCLSACPLKAISMV